MSGSPGATLPGCHPDGGVVKPRQRAGRPRATRGLALARNYRAWLVAYPSVHACSEFYPYIRPALSSTSTYTGVSRSRFPVKLALFLSVLSVCLALPLTPTLSRSPSAPTSPHYVPLLGFHVTKYAPFRREPTTYCTHSDVSPPRIVPMAPSKPNSRSQNRLPTRYTPTKASGPVDAKYTKGIQLQQRNIQ